LKLYEIIIKPVASFGTPLKGDTIFGHFCWQLAYNPSLLNGGLEQWIACYGERPFAVFSSAWPKLRDNKESFYALKRLDLPRHLFFRHHRATEKRALKNSSKTRKRSG